MPSNNRRNKNEDLDTTKVIKQIVQKKGTSKKKTCTKKER